MELRGSRSSHSSRSRLVTLVPIPRRQNLLLQLGLPPSHSSWVKEQEELLAPGLVSKVHRHEQQEQRKVQELSSPLLVTKALEQRNAVRAQSLPPRWQLSLGSTRQEAEGRGKELEDRGQKVNRGLEETGRGGPNKETQECRTLGSCFHNCGQTVTVNGLCLH